MKTTISSQLKKLSVGFLSLILFSCSETPADERNGIPEELQVVTKSAVIYGDGSADKDQIVGVRDELVIGNAEIMNGLYPKQALSMSSYMDMTVPGITTKTFVKTTIRKARVAAADKEETLTGWPIDVHAAIVSLVESLKDRIKNNQSIHIIVELWFDPVSPDDFYNIYHDGPYTSILSGDETE